MTTDGLDLDDDLGDETPVPGKKGGEENESEAGDEPDEVTEPSPPPPPPAVKPRSGFASLFAPKVKPPMGNLHTPVPSPKPQSPKSEPVKAKAKAKPPTVKPAKKAKAAKPIKVKAPKPTKVTAAKPNPGGHPTRGESFTAQAIKEGRRLVTEPMVYQETFRTTESEHARLEQELVDVNTIAAKKGQRPHRSMAQFLRHKLGFVTAGL